MDIFALLALFVAVAWGTCDICCSGILRIFHLKEFQLAVLTQCWGCAGLVFLIALFSWLHPQFLPAPGVIGNIMAIIMKEAATPMPRCDSRHNLTDSALYAVFAILPKQNFPHKVYLQVAHLSCGYLAIGFRGG